MLFTKLEMNYKFRPISPQSGMQAWAWGRVCLEFLSQSICSRYVVRNYAVSNFPGSIIILKFLSPFSDHELTVTLSAQ